MRGDDDDGVDFGTPRRQRPFGAHNFASPTKTSLECSLVESVKRAKEVNIKLLFHHTFAKKCAIALECAVPTDEQSF